MKKQKVQKLISYILIAIIIIGGGVWYYLATIKSNRSPIKVVQKKEEIAQILPVTTDDKYTKEKIIFASFGENNKEIISYDLISKERKVLFTDADEEQKIKQFGGLAYLSKEILVFVGDGPVGKLEIIKVDGSGKKEIINDSFGKTSVLSISPDGELITYVGFSNAEADYGYGIYQIGRDGSNRRKLVNFEDEVKNVVWSPDSSQIAYQKNNKNGQKEIGIVDVESGKTESLYTTADPIATLSWNENEQLLITKGKDGKYSTGEVVLINPKNGSAKKIVETEKDMPSYANISADNINIDYIITAFGDNFDNSKAGQIYVSLTGGDNLEKLDSANIILGFLP